MTASSSSSMPNCRENRREQARRDLVSDRHPRSGARVRTAPRSPGCPGPAISRARRRARWSGIRRRARRHEWRASCCCVPDSEFVDVPNTISESTSDGSSGGVLVSWSSGCCSVLENVHVGQHAADFARDRDVQIGAAVAVEVDRARPDRCRTGGPERIRPRHRVERSGDLHISSPGSL